MASFFLSKREKVMKKSIFFGLCGLTILVSASLADEPITKFGNVSRVADNGKLFIFSSSEVDKTQPSRRKPVRLEMHCDDSIKILDSEGTKIKVTDLREVQLKGPELYAVVYTTNSEGYNLCTMLCQATYLYRRVVTEVDKDSFSVEPLGPPKMGVKLYIHSLAQNEITNEKLKLEDIKKNDKLSVIFFCENGKNYALLVGTAHPQL
jgi:hypothetical protein